jgi:hypothetical protein
MYDQAFKNFYNRPVIYWRRLKRIHSLSLLRDTVEAFLYIILRVKVGQRGSYKKEWLRCRREDFFDFDFSQPRSETESQWARNISDQLDKLFPQDHSEKQVLSLHESSGSTHPL